MASTRILLLRLIVSGMIAGSVTADIYIAPSYAGITSACSSAVSTSNRTCPNLREALAAVADTENIFLLPGVFSGPFNVGQLIARNIGFQIYGSSDPKNRSIFDAGRTDRWLTVTQLTAVTITNVDVVNGLAAPNSAGGCLVYQPPSGDFFLLNVTFTNCGANGAGGNGGAIDLSGAGFKMTGGAISGCTATQGGGIYISGLKPLAGPFITGTTFLNNVATVSGGAIDIILATYSISMANCNFTNNAAGTRGGAIHVYADAAVSVGDSVFNGGSANEGGLLACESPNGAAEGAGGPFTFYTCTLTGGTAVSKGGCIWASRDSLFMLSSSTTLSGCAAGYQGGGMWVGSYSGDGAVGSADIDGGSSIQYSSAPTGSAIYAQDGALVRLDRGSSILSNNGQTGTLTAWGVGTVITVMDSTVTGNTAIKGGAVHVSAGGSAILLGAVVSGNTAVYAGGAIYSDGDVSISSSSITRNTAGYGGAVAFADGNGAICRRINMTTSNITFNTASIAAGAFYVDQMSRPCTTYWSIDNATDSSSFYGGNTAAIYGNYRAAWPSKVVLLAAATNNSGTVIPSPVPQPIDGISPGHPVSVLVALQDVYNQSIPLTSLPATYSLAQVASSGGITSVDAPDAAFRYGSSGGSPGTNVSNIRVYGFPGAVATLGITLIAGAGSPSSTLLPTQQPMLQFSVGVGNCPAGTELTTTSTPPMAPMYCAPCPASQYNFDAGGKCKPCPNSGGIACRGGSNVQVARGYFAAMVPVKKSSSDVYEVDGGEGDQWAVERQQLTGNGTAMVLSSFSGYGDAPYPVPTTSALTLLDVSKCQYGTCCRKAFCAINDQCAPHRTGFQCGQCVAGFINTGTQCIRTGQCDRGNKGFIAVAVVATVLVTIIILHASSHHRKADAILCSLLLLAQLTYFLTLDADPILRFITGTVQLNVGDLHFLLYGRGRGGACIGRYDDLTLIALGYPMPLAILGLILLMTLAHMVVHRKSFALAWPSYLLALQRTLEVACAVLISTSIKLVTCTPAMTLTASGQRGSSMVLMAAPDVQCYVGRHLGYGIFAWIVLGLVCVVWPLVTVCGVRCLVGSRGSMLQASLAVRDDDGSSSTYRQQQAALARGAWFLPYRPAMRQWGAAFLILRRVALLLCASVLQFAPIVVPTALLFVVAAAIVATVRFDPFSRVDGYGAATAQVDVATLAVVLVMAHLASARVATAQDPSYAAWSDFQNILFIVALSIAGLGIVYTALWLGRREVMYNIRWFMDGWFRYVCCGTRPPKFWSNEGRLDASGLQVAYTAASMVVATSGDITPCSVSAADGSDGGSGTGHPKPVMPRIAVASWLGTSGGLSRGISDGGDADSAVTPVSTPTVTLSGQHHASGAGHGRTFGSGVVRLNPLAALHKQQQQQHDQHPSDVTSTLGAGQAAASDSGNAGADHVLGGAASSRGETPLLPAASTRTDMPPLPVGQVEGDVDGEGQQQQLMPGVVSAAGDGDEQLLTARLPSAREVAVRKMRGEA